MRSMHVRSATIHVVVVLDAANTIPSFYLYLSESLSLLDHFVN